MCVVLESIEGTSILGPANGCCVPLRPLNRGLIQAEQGKGHFLSPLATRRIGQARKRGFYSLLREAGEG
jgi:hypothetical protein